MHARTRIHTHTHCSGINVWFLSVLMEAVGPIPHYGPGQSTATWWTPQVEVQGEIGDCPKTSIASSVLTESSIL